MFIIDTLLDCGLKKNQFSINISNRKLIQGLFNKLNIDMKIVYRPHPWRESDEFPDISISPTELVIDKPDKVV